jgi:hypothetical protein
MSHPGANRQDRDMPVRIRRPLALSALSFLVAAGASVAALYHHEPAIGLRTSRAPLVELPLADSPPAPAAQ